MNTTEVKSVQLLIDLNSTFAIIGCLASILAVVLILITKAYRQYVYRLQLYLAIVCLVFAASLGFETLPVTVENSTVTVREGWDDVCVAIGYVAQHFGFSKTLCIVWICVYVFMVAIFQKQLRQLRHEVIGLIVMVGLPALIAWMPLVHGSYGLDGIWCWIKGASDGVNSSFKFATEIFAFLLHGASIVLVFAAVLKFCSKCAITSPYRAALKEVLPLTIYPSIYSIATLTSAIVGILDVAKQSDSAVDEMVVVGFIQTFVLVLPLSFFLHQRMRHELLHLIKKTLGKSDTPSTWVSASEPSVSYAETSLPPIEPANEREHLVNSRSTGYVSISA